MRKIRIFLVICVVIFAITNVVSASDRPERIVEEIIISTLTVKKTTLLILETTYGDGGRDIYATNINRGSRTNIYENLGYDEEAENRSATKYREIVENELTCAGLNNSHYSLVIPYAWSFNDEEFNLEIAEDLLNKLMTFQESCNQINDKPPENGLLAIEMSGVGVLDKISNIPGTYNLFVTYISYLLGQKYLWTISSEILYFSRYLYRASDAEKKQGIDFLKSLLEADWITSPETEGKGKRAIEDELDYLEKSQ